MLVNASRAGRLTVDDGWQPIETAPRDGTRILVWHPEEGAAISLWGKTAHVPFYGFLDMSGAFDGADILDPKPTLWRPLPALPKGEGAE